MGMEQLWVFDDSALREVYTQEGTKPDGAGSLFFSFFSFLSCGKRSFFSMENPD